MKEYTIPDSADKNKWKVQFKPNSNKSLFDLLENLGGLEPWNLCKGKRTVRCLIFTRFNIISHMNDGYNKFHFSELTFFWINEPSDISSISVVHCIILWHWQNIWWNTIWKENLLKWFTNTATVKPCILHLQQSPDKNPLLL